MYTVIHCLPFLKIAIVFFFFKYWKIFDTFLFSMIIDFQNHDREDNQPLYGFADKLRELYKLM